MINGYSFKIIAECFIYQQVIQAEYVIIIVLNLQYISQERDPADFLSYPLPYLIMMGPLTSNQKIRAPSLIIISSPKHPIIKSSLTRCPQASTMNHPTSVA